jgi:hypothetical protein
MEDPPDLAERYGGEPHDEIPRHELNDFGWDRIEVIYRHWRCGLLDEKGPEKEFLGKDSHFEESRSETHFLKLLIGENPVSVFDRDGP